MSCPGEGKKREKSSSLNKKLKSELRHVDSWKGGRKEIRFSGIKGEGG